VAPRPRRVDELLSGLGYGSRREVQALCDAGRLTLHGEPVRRAADRLDAHALRVDGEALEFPDGLVALVHKPVGYVCSHREGEGRLVYELLPPRWRRRDPPVTTVGRLDRDTSGLVVVTDRGSLVHALTSPRRHVDKVYRATLDGELTDELVQAFAQGLVLAGEPTPTLPARVVPLGPAAALVTLREGRYHQVRRMFAACGRLVVSLARVRVGPWELGDLPPGAWRTVTLESLPGS
jgi:16S rRNA pseudouridine516 synthase